MRKLSLHQRREVETMIDVDEQVGEAALTLHAQGFVRCEAYPIYRWRKLGWPENDKFFRAVDACISLLRALDEMRAK